MAVIFGFGPGHPEDLGEVAPCVCPNCHNQVFLHHVRSKKSVRLYFVPVVALAGQPFSGHPHHQPVRGDRPAACAEGPQGRPGQPPQRLIHHLRLKSARLLRTQCTGLPGSVQQRPGNPGR
jgi:hypothetical protein